MFDRSGTTEDASRHERRDALRSVLIVDAAAASVTARAVFDPELPAVV